MYSTDCTKGAASVVCANRTLTCTSAALGAAYYGSAAPAIALDYTVTVSGPAGVAKDGILDGGLSILGSALHTGASGAFASPIGGFSFATSTNPTFAVRSVVARPVGSRRMQQLMAAAVARVLGAAPPPNLTVTLVVTLLLVPRNGTPAQVLAALQPVYTSGALAPAAMQTQLRALLSGSTSTYAPALAWKAASASGAVAVTSVSVAQLLDASGIASTEAVGRFPMAAPPGAAGGASAGGGGAGAAVAGVIVALLAVSGGFVFYKLRTTGEFQGRRLKMVGTVFGLVPYSDRLKAKLRMHGPVRTQSSRRRRVFGQLSKPGEADGAEPVSTLNWLGATKAAKGGDDGSEVEEAAPKQKAAFAPVAAADGGAKFAAAEAAQAAAGGVGGAEGDEDKTVEGEGGATANPTQVSVNVVETRWIEYHDNSNGDVWYVSEAGEQTEWTLPEGGVVVARHEA